jgi:hypothetical protein
MAFAITEDHGRQEAVHERLSYNRDASTIRAHHGLCTSGKAGRRNSRCTAGAIGCCGAAGERSSTARASGRHSAGCGKSPRCHADAS